MTAVAIYNFECVELPMLNAVLGRLKRHHPLDCVEIFVNARRTDGWLEYLAMLKYEGGAKLTIGCIQRRPSEEIEFHT
jgi:hypothetical protein